MANRPEAENSDGKDTDGFASKPPIVGPMMVPIDHTKGITAYARAVDFSFMSSFF